MFSAVQLEAFHRDGFVRLAGALDGAQVESMRARMWQRLERNGADPGNPATWSADKAFSLQKIRRADRPPADCPVVCAAMDAIFGAQKWAPPKDWGQALVTFPTTAPWAIPWHVWHLDHSYQYPRDAIRGVNLFTFLSDVEPRGGGTLVVRASHRLVDRFVGSVCGLSTKKMKVLRKQFNATDPWWMELTAGGDGSDADRRQRFMDVDTNIDGIDVRVVELTGKAGDVVLGHPWLVHNGSPNTLAQPRMMRACRIYGCEYKQRSESA